MKCPWFDGCRYVCGDEHDPNDPCEAPAHIAQMTNNGYTHAEAMEERYEAFKQRLMREVYAEGVTDLAGGGRTRSVLKEFNK